MQDILNEILNKMTEDFQEENFLEIRKWERTIDLITHNKRRRKKNRIASHSRIKNRRRIKK